MWALQLSSENQAVQQCGAPLGPESTQQQAVPVMGLCSFFIYGFLFMPQVLQEACSAAQGAVSMGGWQHAEQSHREHIQLRCSTVVIFLVCQSFAICLQMSRGVFYPTEN